RVDVAVVADVVAEVGHWGAVEGRDPDRVHAEPGQVVQPVLDAGQVADAVSAGVLERSRVDLVDHRVSPPGDVSAGVHAPVVPGSRFSGTSLACCRTSGTRTRSSTA